MPLVTAMLAWRLLSAAPIWSMVPWLESVALCRDPGALRVGLHGDLRAVPLDGPILKADARALDGETLGSRDGIPSGRFDLREPPLHVAQGGGGGEADPLTVEVQPVERVAAFSLGPADGRALDGADLAGHGDQRCAGQAEFRGDRVEGPEVFRGAKRGVGRAVRDDPARLPLLQGEARHLERGVREDRVGLRG